jgi:hypothetical protein
MASMFRLYEQPSKVREFILKKIDLDYFGEEEA